jgi:hypothetical protein
MPSTRKRRAHGSALTEEIIATLGLGSGINWIPDSELKAMWREHGEAVTAHWQRAFNDEPFVAMIAREEGWNDAD